MLDRHHLRRTTASMIRYALVLYPSRDGETATAWRSADRHELAEALAAEVVNGCGHLLDIQVTREAVDALRRARRRASGCISEPVARRSVPGSAAPARGWAALRGHTAAAATDRAALPWLVGRVVADLLHVVQAEGYDPNHVVLASLDAFQAEMTTIRSPPMAR